MDNKQFYVRILIAIAFIIFMVFVISQVHAHGDAQWIADGGFVGIDGVKCCGVGDCDRVPPGAVERVAGGWRIKSSGQIFLDGSKGLYESRDIEGWWCIFIGEEDHKRCLFYPQSAG